MGRRKGQSRIMTPYEACSQVEFYVTRKGYNILDFALAYAAFVPVYAKLRQEVGRMSIKIKVKKDSGLRGICKATWRYAERQKIEPTLFSSILLEYAEIKKSYKQFKEEMKRFKEKYHCAQDTSAPEPS